MLIYGESKDYVNTTYKILKIQSKGQLTFNKKYYLKYFNYKIIYFLVLIKQYY